MNTLPDFDASAVDSDSFRDFIRKFSRSSAMEAWDREKTFQRGGQKTAAEKDARWIGTLARGVGNFARGATGKGVAKALMQPGAQNAILAGQAATRGVKSLAALPLRAVERGVHAGRTLGSNVASGFRGTPSTMAYGSGIARMPGSPWQRAALGATGWGAAGVAGASLTGGPDAPAATPAAAAAPAAKPAAPASPAPTPAAAAAPTPAAASVPAVPKATPQNQPAPIEASAAPVVQPDGKSDGPIPPSQRSTALAAPPVVSPRAKITQQNAGTINAVQRQNGRVATEQDLLDYENQRLAVRAKRPKKPSFYVDPKTNQEMQLDDATGEWMPKAAPVKTAAETRDILRWLLGSALIGAGARTSVSLYNNLTAPPPLKASDQLYDPEIEIPIDFTPEQMAKYKTLSAPAAKKMAAAWDNTLAALTMTGGGVLGWSLAHAMIRRQKEKALDVRLQKLRDELSQLSQPEISPVVGPDAPKLAAAQDFFHIAAERYQKHVKEAGVPKQILDLIAKAKQLPGQAKATWQGMDPMMKVLAAGGTGLAAAPLIPGVRHITGGVGDVATGGVLEGLKTVGRPIGYGAAATLGPVAALGALYALYKGYETAEKDDPQTKELKALREAIREREIEERPYFKLTPRVQESAA